MAEGARRKPPATPLSPLGRSLALMGARKPSDDETMAIRALLRGHASEGQQRMASAYLLVELCGVGSVPFVGENSHASSFRAGSLAVGITLSQIADAVIMRFPGEERAGHGAD